MTTSRWLAAYPVGADTMIVFISCGGNVGRNQLTASRDWPFGAACSLVMMALVMLLLRLFLRKAEDQLL